MLLTATPHFSAVGKKKKSYLSGTCRPKLASPGCLPVIPKSQGHPETPGTPRPPACRRGGQRPPGGSGLQPSTAPGAPGPAPASLRWMEGEKDAGLTGVLLLHWADLTAEHFSVLWETRTGCGNAECQRTAPGFSAVSHLTQPTR